MRRWAVFVLGVAVLSLAACGVRTDLKPRQNAQLPPAPYGQTTQPNAADLLATTSQAKPGRNVELREKSEERGDDPFDLPPKK